jgi:hypothetical protein
MELGTHRSANHECITRRVNYWLMIWKPAIRVTATTAAMDANNNVNKIKYLYNLYDNYTRLPSAGRNALTETD